MSRFFRDNGLTIVLLLLFVASIVGHWITGWHFHNEQLQDHGQGADHLDRLPLRSAVPVDRIRELGKRVPADVRLRRAHRLSVPAGILDRRIRTSPRGQAIRLRGRRSAMLRLPSGAEQQCRWVATRSGSSYSCSS